MRYFAVRFGRFDQVPKLWVLLQNFVLFDRKVGPVEKVFERIFIQNPVNQHAQLIPFKINAVIRGYRIYTILQNL